MVVPAYNAEAILPETLHSILGQTYPHMEVIVVDDGSTDKTAEIVHSMAVSDHRLHLLRQRNAGVAAARNRGIEAAKGEFIAPIDADDIWLSHNLEKQLNRMMQADDPVDVVYSWSLEIDQENRLSGGFHSARFEGDVFFALLHTFFIGHASATLIRKKCFEKIGGYDSRLREQGAEGCEDWDLYLRMAEGFRFGVVPEFLIGYRQIPGNMGTRLSVMAASHDLVLENILKRHPNIPNKWHRWSKANFRMYLAMRSHENCHYEDSTAFILKAFRLDPLGMLLRHDTCLWVLAFCTGLPLKPFIDSKPTPATIARRVKIQQQMPIKRLQRFRLSRMGDLQKINGFPGADTWRSHRRS